MLLVVTHLVERLFSWWSRVARLLSRSPHPPAVELRPRQPRTTTHLHASIHNPVTTSLVLQPTSGGPCRFLSALRPSNKLSPTTALCQALCAALTSPPIVDEGDRPSSPMVSPWPCVIAGSQQSLHGLKRDRLQHKPIRIKLYMPLAAVQGGRLHRKSGPSQIRPTYHDPKKQRRKKDTDSRGIANIMLGAMDQKVGCTRTQTSSFLVVESNSGSSRHWLMALPVFLHCPTKAPSCLYTPLNTVCPSPPPLCKWRHRCSRKRLAWPTTLACIGHRATSGTVSTTSIPLGQAFTYFVCLCLLIHGRICKPDRLSCSINASFLYYSSSRVSIMLLYGTSILVCACPLHPVASWPPACLSLHPVCLSVRTALASSSFSRARRPPHRQQCPPASLPPPPSLPATHKRGGEACESASHHHGASAVWPSIHPRRGPPTCSPPAGPSVAGCSTCSTCVAHAMPGTDRHASQLGRLEEHGMLSAIGPPPPPSPPTAASASTGRRGSPP